MTKKMKNENLKNFLAFMLNKNARAYHYHVDPYANWETYRKNIKDIFELECFYSYRFYLTPHEIKTMFLEWINGLDCIISVLDNIEYTEEFTLVNFVPTRLRNKSEQAMVDYVNNQIFELIYGA